MIVCWWECYPRIWIDKAAHLSNNTGGLTKPATDHWQLTTDKILFCHLKLIESKIVEGIFLNIIRYITSFLLEKLTFLGMAEKRHFLETPNHGYKKSKKIWPQYVWLSFGIDTICCGKIERREKMKTPAKMMARFLQLQLTFLPKKRPKKVGFNLLFLKVIIFR